METLEDREYGARQLLLLLLLLLLLPPPPPLLPRSLWMGDFATLSRGVRSVHRVEPGERQGGAGQP